MFWAASLALIAVTVMAQRPTPPPGIMLFLTHINLLLTHHQATTPRIQNPPLVQQVCHICVMARAPCLYVLRCLASSR